MHKHIHFVGIKGVGVTPLAIIAKEAGITVTGCDIAADFITNEPLTKAGIVPLVGFSDEHLTGVDLIITTGAHGGLKNPEVAKANEKGIPILTQGEAVGLFMKGKIFSKTYKGISITGCHGKTTTTAMIATILKEVGADPSFIIGTGVIPSLGASGHFGKGDFFVAEADEYATEPNFDKTPKFMWQFPEILVITNIEYDHPDVYESLTALRQAYELFTKNLQPPGILVINGDDEESQKLLMSYKGKKITFGFGEQNDIVITNRTIEKGKVIFSLSNLGKFLLSVPGKHNILNATAAVIAAKEAGFSIEAIQKGLQAFIGTKRRIEYQGILSSGALLYDDYAHHPTEIKATLETLKEIYPDKKIVCIFQPHTYSRTKSLFEEFIHSFSDADEIILAEIYASLREAIDPSISSQKLADEIKKTGKDIFVLGSLVDVVQYVEEKKFDDSYVLVTMGAGDIYKAGESLIS